MSEETVGLGEAERLGPGQFLLDAQRLQVGLKFSVEGHVFMVVSGPVVLTEMNYLVSVHESEGPDAGRQLTVQVRLGRRGQ
jgi:hypothetical protein